MVTKVSEVTTKPSIPVIGASIGVPIKIRPWWGSAREQSFLVHQECGERVYPAYGTSLFWCPNCGRTIAEKLTEQKRITPRWLCPGGITHSRIKWPEVQNGVVILWEGQCRMKMAPRKGRTTHSHRQSLEVLDVGETAFLLKISVSSNSSHFLIGTDDDHPFITPILRRLATVQDAFDWLVPNKVSEAMMLGKDVKRQGDWFFIPTEKWPRIYRHGVWDSRFSPGVGTQYCHVPLVYGDSTRHSGSTVVYQTFQGLPNPAPVVKGTIKSPDHPPLHLESWHIAIRQRQSTGGRGGSPSID